jgi:hypothetical protein
MNERIIHDLGPLIKFWPVNQTARQGTFSLHSWDPADGLAAPELGVRGLNVQPRPGAEVCRQPTAVTAARSERGDMGMMHCSRVLLIRRSSRPAAVRLSLFPHGGLLTRQVELHLARSREIHGP